MPFSLGHNLQSHKYSSILQKKKKSNGNIKDEEADKNAHSSLSENTDIIKSSEAIKIEIDDDKINEQNKISTYHDITSKSTKSNDSVSDESMKSESNTKTEEEVLESNIIPQQQTTKDAKNAEDLIIATAIHNNNNSNTEKCDICGQFLNNSDLIYYHGHPQNAVEEYIALTNEKLVLSSGKVILTQ